MGISLQAWAEVRSQSPEELATVQPLGQKSMGGLGWVVVLIAGASLRVQGLSPSVSPRPLLGGSVIGRGSEDGC